MFVERISVVRLSPGDSSVGSDANRIPGIEVAGDSRSSASRTHLRNPVASTNPTRLPGRGPRFRSRFWTGALSHGRAIAAALSI
jgi:hypothetical protein